MLDGRPWGAGMTLLTTAAAAVAAPVATVLASAAATAAAAWSPSPDLAGRSWWGGLRCVEGCGHLLPPQIPRGRAMPRGLGDVSIKQCELCPYSSLWLCLQEGARSRPNSTCGQVCERSWGSWNPAALHPCVGAGTLGGSQDRFLGREQRVAGTHLPVCESPPHLLGEFFCVLLEHLLPSLVHMLLCPTCVLGTQG